MRGLALAAALVLLLGPAPARSQPAPVVIDVIDNLSGGNAFIGQTYQTALQVLEQYINKTGGIAGRPLHFEFYDDTSSVATAVQIATQLIAKHPAVVLGPAQTATCAAVAPLFANGPVDYCLSTAFSPSPKDYVFASSYSISTHGGPTALRFMRLSGYKRLAIIDPTDATGQASDRMMESAQKLPPFQDMNYVDWEHFNPTDLSVAAQVQRMAAAHPDAIVTFAGGTAFGTVLRGLRDAGINLPVLSSGANLNPQQMEQYAPVMPPALFLNASVYFGRDAVPRGHLRTTIDAFYDAYAAAGKEVSPGSGFAWDPGWIVVSALRKLGPTASAAQLHDYLENLHDFDGICGSYDFRTTDQHGLGDNGVLFVRWDPAKTNFVVASKPGGYPLK